jgi:hypothetical protein
MNVHVLPIERLTRAAARSPRLGPGEGQGFAQVYDLEAARRARGPTIPDEVLDEVAAAARLCDELQARGGQVRFGLHDLTGGVVVDLCDLDGKILRPISLTDAVTAPADPDPAA